MKRQRDMVRETERQSQRESGLEREDGDGER